MFWICYPLLRLDLIFVCSMYVVYDVTFQILFSWLYQKGKIPESWPLIEILYCLCQGLLFHARVMHEDVCPKYIVNLMHTVTSNKWVWFVYWRIVPGSNLSYKSPANLVFVWRRLAYRIVYTYVYINNNLYAFSFVYVIIVVYIFRSFTLWYFCLWQIT